jgi:hypothetical protein
MSFNNFSPITLESCSASAKGLLGFDVTVVSHEELDDGNELDEEVA